MIDVHGQNAGNNGFLNLEARMRGYNDRTAHRIGRTEFRDEHERKAYEAGVAAADKMLIANTEREALSEVMAQAESDLKSAHAEICKLQGLDPAKHDWPEWSPQANSLRWFKAIREKFSL